jgi:predicted enzyme related to lactoylglutathione lyase
VTHRRRLAQIVIDVDDLDAGDTFWAAALDAKEEPLSETSNQIYRRLRLPDSEVRILLQRTPDPKQHKERMHLYLEADNVEAEVRRLEALGATRYDHLQERGYDFWVLRDPGPTSSAPYRPTSPTLLAQRPAWVD